MDAFREFQLMSSEALSAAEQELALEDKGWISSGGSGDGITSNTRVTNLKTSRIYAQRDPLCKQAIRLWTDYSFGTGMTWNSEDEPVKSVLSNFWDSLANQPVLSAKGQRKSSDKVLIDGEIFFAVFPEPSGKATIRRIDPLEITELVTDPDDAEDVRFYKREWMNRQSKQQTAYYRSAFNPNNLPCEDSTGFRVTSDQDAVVFHLAINTIGERGNPLLLPILDWIKLYRQFLASRVAIMLAVSKFLWKVKVGGGATEVNAAQAALHGTTQEPASMWVENQGVQLDQIKTDTGARGAYDDARMLRLQFCAGVGWPEQYFGDLSTGNLATAKTVELPVAKMTQSYQQVWSDFYDSIDNFNFDQASIPDDDSRHVDRDFPSIAPEDQAAMAASIQQIIASFPQFADLHDVMQQALMSIGVLNTKEALNELKKIMAKAEKEKAERRALMPPEMQGQMDKPFPQGEDGKPGQPSGNGAEDPSLALAKLLRGFRESIEAKHDHSA